MKSTTRLMEEWVSIQKEIATKVDQIMEINFWETLKYVGGMDIFYSDNIIASFVILEYPSLKIVYEDYISGNATEPYKSGFLSFRELPLLNLLYKRMKERYTPLPQVIFLDGNGLLHPRKAGMACHFGITHNIPTIGVAKNFLTIPDGEKLTMEFVKNESKRKLQKCGDQFDLCGESGFVYGKAVRSSSQSIKPIFVSIGHKITLQAAVELTLKCCKYRVPEPTRLADILGRRKR